MNENKLLLAQLMGGIDGKDAVLAPSDPSLTFLSSSVCKHALVWRCPFEYLISTNKNIPTPRCNLDHNPYFKNQYEEAMRIYRSERMKSEPSWDGEAEGDPWGYSHGLLVVINKLLIASDETKQANLQRPDVFKTLNIKDEFYAELTTQIESTYRRIDSLVTADLEKYDEMIFAIQTIQDLEKKRTQVLHRLVRDQMAAIQSYRETRSQASDPGSIPKPPLVIDIQAIIQGPYDLDNPPEHLRTEGDLLRVLHAFKMTPCVTCGGLLNLEEDTKRVLDHFSGRVHIAYRDLRLECLRLMLIEALPMDHFPRSIQAFLDRDQLNTLHEKRKKRYEHANEDQCLIPQDPHPWRNWARTFRHHHQDGQLMSSSVQRFLQLIGDLPTDQKAQWDHLITLKQSQQDRVCDIIGPELFERLFLEETRTILQALDEKDTVDRRKEDKLDDTNRKENDHDHDHHTNYYAQNRRSRPNDRSLRERERRYRSY